MLATWWQGDPIPEVEILVGLRVRLSQDPSDFTPFDIPVEEAARRMAEGHRAYIAEFEGRPAAYGWVATRAAEIGELRLRFSIPARERYLWDFKTHPEFRGLGIYPRLLLGIVRHESKSADRLWILASPENTPSNVGIERAGFVDAGTVAFLENGRPGLQARGAGARAFAAAAFLGVELTTKPARPCWACEAGETGETCGCSHRGGNCTCGIAIPSRGSAAA